MKGRDIQLRKGRERAHADMEVREMVYMYSRH